MEKLFFHATIEPTGDIAAPRLLALSGREAWALLNLVEAGETGCTPITSPAPRWSHYVWLLRGDGFAIETIHEEHGGPFSGTHARYVLHDQVILEGGNLHQWRPAGIQYPVRKAVAA